MRGVKEKNIDPRMEDFRSKLEEIGYKKATIVKFCCGIRKYIKRGHPLDMDKAPKILEEEGKNKQEFPNSYVVGVIKFIQYINGETLTKVEPRKRRSKSRVFTKCNEDCFNCQYDDCIMPSQYCTSIPYELWTGFATRKKDRESDYFYDELGI